jgi:glycosyltransferase involved in cell wall biosynthesis
MKVLYISHMKESSGWANAATEQILALDAVGVDVVCRNITLTQDKQGVHPRILELESKTTEGCTHCIQHVLPHHLVATDHFKKNIAFTELESTSIKDLSWLENLKLMDEVWVPNSDLKDSLIKDGLKLKEVKKVHHPCDISRYKTKYPPMSVSQAEGKFKFYYIGDLNDRKNLDSLIRCFHSEFSPSEPACLILKVRKFGHSADQVKQIIDQMIVNVKNGLRMYSDIRRYSKDIVIAEDITNENVYSLHQYGDCFVSPTHGEAWSIPAFDAMGFGSFVITSDYGGPKEFLSHSSNSAKVRGQLSICQCSDAAFPHIFTGREYWFDPCEKEIRRAMRFAYYSHTKNPISFQKGCKQRGMETVEKFSYEVVGDHMKGLLNNE